MKGGGSAACARLGEKLEAAQQENQRLERHNKQLEDEDEAQEESS